MPARLDLTGRRFGKLVATERAPNCGGRTQWRCKCDCGQYTVVRTQNLISGNTVSCGCRRAEANRDTRTTHGMRQSLEYAVWHKMLDRCRRPKHPYYDRYGGRGIKVCERWVRFENFYADMGPRPSPKHSLDRVDNDGDYEPENCRWATQKQQVRNRSNTRKLVFRGQTRSMGAWAEMVGIDYRLLWIRLRNGWSVEQALTTPVKPTRPRKSKVKSEDCQSCPAG
jgi:hypothetical protein